MSRGRSGAVRAVLRLAAVLLAVFAALAGGAPAARAADELKCECEIGVGACQHFLRNPAGPTDDPCWCARCDSGLQGRRHDGTQVPEGWNPECFRSTRLPCYLKRHAAAWGIACSDCAQAEKCCNYAQHQACPDCDEPTLGPALKKDAAGRDPKKHVLERLAKERTFFKKPDEVVVAYSRNFYLVTDIKGLKVRMPPPLLPRTISRHEWVHLTLERAEYCRRAWVRVLGEPRMERSRMPGEPRDVLPMAMYFTEKERERSAIAAATMDSPTATFVFGTAIRPADGMCMTAFAYANESCKGDHNLQVVMRHQIAHNLFSCWAYPEGTPPKSLPQWAYEGLAQWMTRLPKHFAESATCCLREGQAIGGSDTSGKDWEKDCAKMAASATLDPIEKLLSKTVKGELTEDDQRRSWSLVSLGLAELGKPFVELLADLRKQREMREAFMARLGMTPDELDRRWRERVTGKRASLADPAPAEVPPAGGATGRGPPPDPSARERASIRDEQDPVALAAKIRQLGTLTDAGLVEEVVDAFARKSDLVRETAAVTLLKLKDDACRKRMRERGLSHGEWVVRAYTARICGALGLADAAPRLVELLADPHWFPRAEAAVALGRLRHAEAIPALRKMTQEDPAEKARVGALDGLAAFGEAAAPAVPQVAKLLTHSQWQIRVAATQTLGATGSMEAVEPLITRMEQESGRVREEIRTSLKAITRDDFGMNPDYWRKWWNRVKEDNAGKTPPRPSDPAGSAAAKPVEDKYAKYYGVEIHSDRVAFLVDTSMSMALLFDPDPSAAKALSREYTGHDKLTICREEVAQTLRALPPRSAFLVVTFGTQVKAFKPNPVPANKGNVEDALQFLVNTKAAGETNYYDAFKSALDLEEEPYGNADFRSTPDTISFLTDGEPTAGAITEGAALVEWYTGMNRYARMVTHTVTFGVNRVDQETLRNLAERNWGRYTLVPERARK